MTCQNIGCSGNSVGAFANETPDHVIGDYILIVVLMIIFVPAVALNFSTFVTLKRRYKVLSWW